VIVSRTLDFPLFVYSWFALYFALVLALACVGEGPCFRVFFFFCSVFFFVSDPHLVLLAYVNPSIAPPFSDLPGIRGACRAKGGPRRDPLCVLGLFFFTFSVFLLPPSSSPNPTERFPLRLMSCADPSLDITPSRLYPFFIIFF